MIEKDKITIGKLGFSLDDIFNCKDDLLELQKKIEGSENYARTILWLAWKFLEEKVGHITNKDYSKRIKKTPQNSIQILENLVVFNLLDNYKRGKFRAILFHLKNPVMLRELVPYAKKAIGLDDKLQRKLK